MLLKKILIVLFGGMFAFTFQNATKADFRVCNTTQEVIGVSIGYQYVCERFRIYD